MRGRAARIRIAIAQRRGRQPGLVLLLAGGLVAMLVAGCSGAMQDDTGGGDAGGEDRGSDASIRIEPSQSSSAVSPAVPITVSASDGTLVRVTVTNAEGEPVAGELSARQSTWTTTEPLGYDSTYTVTATAVDSHGTPVTRSSTVHTVDPQALAYPSVSPLDGSTVGIGHPVAIYFDEPVEDKQAAEQAIEVNTDPHVDGAWHWFSDTEVHWRPRQFWEPGTTITVDIDLYGVDLGGGVYGETDREISFSIGDAVIARADGATHQMTVSINGEVVRTFPISMGSPEHPSKNGIHVITQQYRTYQMDSRTFGLALDEGGYVIDVAYSTRISNSGEFVHAAPWSVAAQGKRNVSHGCVNLSTQDARWFYNHTQRGDVVILTNTGGPPLRPWDGFGDWQLSWPEWTQDGVA